MQKSIIFLYLAGSALTMQGSKIASNTDLQVENVCSNIKGALPIAKPSKTLNEVKHSVKHVPFPQRPFGPHLEKNVTEQSLHKTILIRRAEELLDQEQQTVRDAQQKARREAIARRNQIEMQNALKMAQQQAEADQQKRVQQAQDFMQRMGFSCFFM